MTQYDGVIKLCKNPAIQFKHNIYTFIVIVTFFSSRPSVPAGRLLFAAFCINAVCPLFEYFTVRGILAVDFLSMMCYHGSVITY